MDVVLYTSQMIDFIDVFILAPHQDGDVVIDRGSKTNHQSHIARLAGVAMLGIIRFATGHIVKHGEPQVLATNFAHQSFPGSPQDAYCFLLFSSCR